jgi:eukaryotic-like serine/threonine-protein kinase
MNPSDHSAGNADQSDEPSLNSGVLPTTDSAGAAAQTKPEEQLRSFGPYRLISKLGEGGMGQVWLAEQRVPLQRQVALKIIRAGLCNDSLLQRFLSERQSLAIMNHPAIAKVFDAGATPDGQPYFVMEYVPGLPITTYCNRRQLKIKERLQLFIKVCDGVQHAHQKAIIHRDLKPANILVVEVDNQPSPRIIDFGLAKNVAPQSADETMFTQAGAFVGTPGFMSPEQLDAGAGDVDTRTDVYSLGAILYTLLTDYLPFQAEDWRKKPFYELVRHLREDDPMPPSSKLGSNPGTLKKIAESRNTQPPQLLTQLRGDLDWITMKALEKDRSRRYGTPSELAADVDRYLHNQPVMARPAGTGYRIRKYVARHRFAVGVTAGLILILAGFAFAQAVQLRRVTRERDRADRITEFMTGMFNVSDPSQSRGNTVTAREILDRSSSQIGTSLAKDPGLRASMMDVMGTVYRNLGLYSQAQSLLQQSVEIKRATFGSEHPETLSSSNTLAEVLMQEGQFADAEELARRNVNSSRRVLGPRHLDTLKSMRTLAAVLEERGQYAEAEKLSREVLASAESILGPDHPDMVGYRRTLAVVLNSLARFGEAEKLLRQNLEIDERTLGPDHPVTLHAMGAVAVTLADAGRVAEAEKIQTGMLDIQRRVLGPEHPDTLQSMSNLANYISDQGRYADAEKLHRKTLEIQRRVLGQGHPETLRTMDNLSNAISEQGRYAEAEKLERETVDLRKRYTGPDHPSTASAVYDLGCILALEGRREEALSYLREAVEHGLPAKIVLNMKDDSDLKSLHSDPRFQELVAAARQRAGAPQQQAAQPR